MVRIRLTISHRIKVAIRLAMAFARLVHREASAPKNIINLLIVSVMTFMGRFWQMKPIQWIKRVAFVRKSKLLMISA